MRFALFFLGEYAGMITTSAVCVALFFGGWDFPGLPRRHCPVIPPSPPASSSASFARIVFFVKTVAIIFVFMWVRWSLPRFRFDQIMMLAWRALIPIALAMLMVTSIIVFAFHGNTYDGLGGAAALTMLVFNVLLGAAHHDLHRLDSPRPSDQPARSPLSAADFPTRPCLRGRFRVIPTE